MQTQKAGGEDGTARITVYCNRGAVFRCEACVVDGGETALIASAARGLEMRMKFYQRAISHGCTTAAPFSLNV